MMSAEVLERAGCRRVWLGEGEGRGAGIRLGFVQVWRIRIRQTCLLSVRCTHHLPSMTRLVLDLNRVLFDQNRGADRVVAGLLVAAVLAGLSRSTNGFFTCLATAVLFRSRRAT